VIRPDFVAVRGAAGAVAIDTDEETWNMSPVEAYRIAIMLLQAVQVADGVDHPRGYTEGALVTTSLDKLK
jgi:hypothetical protein